MCQHGLLTFHLKQQSQQNTMDPESFKPNEVIERVDPRAFSRYVIERLIATTANTFLFECYETENKDRVAIEVTKSKMPQWLPKIVNLQSSPKLQVYLTPNYSVIVGNYHDYNLDKVLVSRDIEAPWVPQDEAIRIFRELMTDYMELKENNIFHGNLSANAIVYEKDKWKIDLVPALLNLFSSDKHYYPTNDHTDRSQVYAFGIILFKCLFGFEPFEEKRVDTFKFSTYLDLLNQKTPQGCTKIVYFLRSKLNLSPQALDLLQKSLSLSIPFSFDNFIEHPWLKLSRNDLKEPQPFGPNSQVRMLSTVQHKYLSKALAAIDRFKTRKVRPYQLPPVKTTAQTKQKVRQQMQEDFHLNKLQFGEGYSEDEQVRDKVEVIELKNSRTMRYFNVDVDTLEDQNPCVELRKYLEEDKKRYGDAPERRAQLMKYGFPYAVAFELLKVKTKQPPQIQQKIDSASILLLQVSNLNFPQIQNPPPLLHERSKPLHDFEYYKPRYRQVLHQLYKHFLNDAIHRYNTAKRQLSDRPNSIEAMKMKDQGLYSYRLCWKLLEASLIVRKAGYEVDLGRIQTSQRKEIEIGINNLLAKYFPNKLY